MRAIGTSSYGPLDRLSPIDVPVPEPGSNQVRVRVHAAALNPADCKVILGEVKILHGRRFPMIVGYDYSGTIEARGDRVTGLEIGTEVFGFLPYAMGNQRGSFAESLVADVSELTEKPAGVPHTIAAAAATPGLTALQMLRDLGRLPESGGRVLITGASGGVGSIAIGVARKLGASVTAIGSGKGRDLARKLGAERVIDRKAGDVYSAATGPFDVIVDAAAAYRWREWQKSLAPRGAFVTTLPSGPFIIDKVMSLFSSTRVTFVSVKSRAADLRVLAQWLSEGLEVPIDRVIPVRDVAKGLEELHRGAALGRIAVDVADGF